ncbi:MAG: FAD-dependent oxidoreductase [Protaetiibacter sp.]
MTGRSRDRLFESVVVGSRTLSSRLVAMPHGITFLEDGYATPDHAGYVERYCAAGVGMFILGSTAVAEEGWMHGRHLRLFDPAVVPGLRAMAEAAQRHGAAFICQLGHVGRGIVSWQDYETVVGPSPIPAFAKGEIPLELDETGIARIRGRFAAAARRCAEAGLDGVEVHSAQGYLLHQFLSPLSNRRTDRYGGALENRARLLFEVLGEVRAAMGDRIVGIKLSAGEGDAAGLSWEEVKEIARRADREGLVDYVSIVVPQLASGNFLRDDSFEPGANRAATRELRGELRAPVVVSQRIYLPETARDILDAGDAGLIGVTRALLADPLWGEKAARGADDEIRPCIGCMQDCRGSTAGHGFGCAVNPALLELRGPRTAYELEGRRAWVVGAGPAGVEASLALARSGARVTLVERDDRVGGRLRIAGSAPNRSAWTRYADYLERAARRDPAVELRLGQAAGADEIAAAAPDVVVLAVGADATTGMDRFPGAPITSDECLADDAALGGRRVVIDLSGGWEAANCVEHLVRLGCPVVYVTGHERVAHRVPEESRQLLLPRLAEAGVPCHVGMEREDAEGRVLINPLLGDRVVIERSDRIVVAGDYRPRTELAARLRLRGVEPVVIGDAVNARGLSRAVREGYRIADRLADLVLEDVAVSG